MQTIHELLSRIRWDEQFGRGEFELAYVERGQESLERIDLRDAQIEKGQTFSFTVLGADELYHSIPFHRVREVYKNGELIWKRP